MVLCRAKACAANSWEPPVLMRCSVPTIPMVTVCLRSASPLSQLRNDLMIHGMLLPYTPNLYLPPLSFSKVPVLFWKSLNHSNISCSGFPWKPEIAHLPSLPMGIRKDPLVPLESICIDLGPCLPSLFSDTKGAGLLLSWRHHAFMMEQVDSPRHWPQQMPTAIPSKASDCEEKREVFLYLVQILSLSFLF